MNGSSAGARAAWAIGAAAVIVHLAVFLTVISHFHISLDAYTDKGDGASYKHVAERIIGDHGQIDEYDSRVFPGYPLLIVLVHSLTRLSIPASALAVTFVAAGLAATLSAFYFKNLPIGLTVAFLLPHTWINFSIAMSEGPMLAAVMLGAVASRKNVAGGGLLFAFAMFIRPAAAIVVIASFVELLVRRGMWAAILMLATAGVAFAVWDYTVAPITGGLFHHAAVYANSPRAYNGQILTWPFHSIITMTLHGHVSPWRWIYIMTHVVLCLTGCVRLAVKTHLVIKNPSTNLFTFTWLALNTLFVLCLGLGPGAWGFNHFPRFTIPALPALAFAWKEFLPRRPWVYIALGAGFFVMAIFAIPQTP
jgi:hypothetical protein